MNLDRPPAVVPAVTDWNRIFGPPDRHRTLRRGECLFQRGASAEAVFAVETGRLRLERALESGALVTLAVLGPGDGVAEAALFSQVYHCDARAEVSSRVAVFARACVLEHLEGNPASMTRLLRRQASQVRRLRALIEIRSSSEKAQAEVRSADGDSARRTSVLAAWALALAFLCIVAALPATGEMPPAPAGAPELLQHRSGPQSPPGGESPHETTSSHEGCPMHGSPGHAGTADPARLARLRALGFFGFLASGDHHRSHHLAMARPPPRSFPALQLREGHPI